ncbi:MAG TPA: PAS domain S-box protein, partial [Rubricoccaceae bacterium]
PYRTVTDRIDGVVVTFVDVTERHRQAEALRESEERYRGIVGQEIVGVHFLGLDRRVTYANARFCDIVGHDGASIVGTPMHDLTHPDDVAENAALFERMTEDGVPFTVEKRYLRPDGTTVWTSETAAVVRDAAGRPQSTLALTLDVTEQKRAEAVLQASAAQATFRSDLADALRPLTDPVEVKAVATHLLGEALQASRVHYGEVDDEAFVVVDRDYTDGSPSLTGRFRMDSFNPALARAHDAGEALVMPDVAHDPGLTKADRAAYAAVGVAAQVCAPLVKGAGLVAVLAVHQAEPRAWTAEEVALVAETAERTWTAVERARAELALAEREDRYRQLYTSMTEGYALCELVFDDDGQPVDYRVLDINPAYETISGLTRDTAVGRTAREIAPGPDVEGFIETYSRVVQDGEPVRFESHLRVLGLWLDTYAFPVGPVEGGQFGVVLTDITERKQAEEALRASAARATFRAALADALRPLADSVDVQAAAARVLGEHLGANRVFYAEVDPDEQAVVRHDYTDGVPSLSRRYHLSEFGPALIDRLR